MDGDLIAALNEIEKEKGISKEIMFEALETALISAFKKNFGTAQNVKIEIDRETGKVFVYVEKTVVEEVNDENEEISLQDANKLNPRLKVGDVARIEVTPKSFGRIAAQTAKQVVIQRIREAERDMMYRYFVNKENDIVSGTVERVDKKNILIDLGNAETVMPLTEKLPNENLKPGDKIKLYVVEVKKTTKGPQIVVSRTHPGLVKRLFEQEVPEIYDGTVEIKSIAREAGSRTKIAVYSNDKNVDSVGACVGFKGNRVQGVVDELKGEKIDIIKWSPEIKEYIAASLSPAKVLSVEMNNTEKIAKVLVPSYQLSLAIGKEGQNARLAAKLTGWKIDINGTDVENNGGEEQ
ncbi:MAG: transcription termination factor NusA [Thermoanaerobacteraceae bacterium]|nr:transcription termination factor NusA [Thermoanaerobacteraceae bacterium]